MIALSTTTFCDIQIHFSMKVNRKYMLVGKSTARINAHKVTQNDKCNKIK